MDAMVISTIIAGSVAVVSLVSQGITKLRRGWAKDEKIDDVVVAVENLQKRIDFYLPLEADVNAESRSTLVNEIRQLKHEAKSNENRDQLVALLADDIKVLRVGADRQEKKVDAVATGLDDLMGTFDEFVKQFETPAKHQAVVRDLLGEAIQRVTSMEASFEGHELTDKRNFEALFEGLKIPRPVG